MIQRDHSFRAHSPQEVQGGLHTGTARPNGVDAARGLSNRIMDSYALWTPSRPPAVLSIPCDRAALAAIRTCRASADGADGFDYCCSSSYMVEYFKN